MASLVTTTVNGALTIDNGSHAYQYFNSGASAEAGFFLKHNGSNIWEIYKRGAATKDFAIYDFGSTNGGIKFQIPHDGTTMALMAGGGTVNCGSGFSYNDTTRLLTITNSGNAGGINLATANVRIYFGGTRAIEGTPGNASGNLTLGEGYSSGKVRLIAGTTEVTGIFKYTNSSASNNTGDLKIIPSANDSGGVGYATQIIGVNIADVLSNNLPKQANTWGGVTGSAAIAINADDNTYGQFMVLTAPQDSSANTELTPRFWITGAGAAQFSGALTAGTGSKVVSTTTDSVFKIETNTVTNGFPVLDLVSSHTTVGGRIRSNGTDLILLDKDLDCTFTGDVAVNGALTGTTAAFSGALTSSSGNKYLAGGWTTIERTSTTEGHAVLYCQKTGTGDQDIARFKYGATAGSVNSGTDAFVVHSTASYFNSSVSIGIAAPGSYKLYVNGTTRLGSNVDLVGNVTPTSNLGSNLGTSSLRFNNIYGHVGNFTGELTTGKVAPLANNAHSSGGANYRWSTVFGVAGNFSGALTGTTATFSDTITTTDGSSTFTISGDSSSNTYLAATGEIRIRPSGTTINKFVIGSNGNLTTAGTITGTSATFSGQLHIEETTSNNELLYLEAKNDDPYADIVASDSGGSIRLRQYSGQFQVFTGGNANTMATNASLAFAITGAGSTVLYGALDVTGTITGDDGLSIQGGTGNAYLQVGSNTGSWTWTNYQNTHKLALEDSDGTGEVLSFDTSADLACVPLATT